MLAAPVAALAAAALAACFGAPQPVAIDGWAGDAMEPFVTRDGGALFFNSSNAPGRQTDIYRARRVTDVRFVLEGPVEGANSAALDDVASLARDGTFALISPRAYARLHATVWVGRRSGGRVEALQPQPALTPPETGGFTMDAELSADGRSLYVADARWRPRGLPTSATLRLARRGPQGWRIDPEGDAQLARVNLAGALTYAAGISEDGMELFFTRAAPQARPPRPPQIWVATRGAETEPFGEPVRLTGLGAFVEGPSVAPDGALYLHARRDGRFVILRAARTCR